MSAFKIGDSPFRAAPGVTNSRKPETKSDQASNAPAKGGFDSADFRPNRLAVMPRMSTVGGKNAQHVRGEAVESLLKESAAELDDYFTEAYGFGKDAE